MRDFLLSFHFLSFRDLFKEYVLGACCIYSTFSSALENTREIEDDAKLEGQICVYLELYFEQLEN